MNRSRIGALAALLVLAGLAARVVPGVAQDLDAEGRKKMYYEVKPAVALVVFNAKAQIALKTQQGTQNFESSVGGGGSGWLITPDGYLVTNGHVVELYHEENENTLKQQLFWKVFQEKFLPGLKAQYEKAGKQLTQEDVGKLFSQLYQASQITLKKDLVVILQNGKVYPAEVKEYSPPVSAIPGKISIPGYKLVKSGKDVAILKIEGHDLPTVRLGNYDDVEIGQTVHVAGYPGVVLNHPILNPETALSPTFTSGQVSALRLNHQGTNVMQMDAAITHGNSGGPVFNEAGEVVGMATFGSASQTGQGQTQEIQGFNFAVPIDAIREFVRAAGIQTGQESLFDRTWDRALAAYYAKDWNQALREFDMALRVMPDLPDAVRLRRTAIRNVEEGGGEVASADAATGDGQTAVKAPAGGGGWPLWAWIAIGAVVIGGALVGLGWSRRGGEAGGRSAAAGATLAEGPAPAEIPAATPAGLLVVRGGPMRGNRFPIEGEVRIGRDPDACQVVLADATVSREHALIRSADGGAEIKNLSGTNPTYVNDRPIQETTLKPGDRIKIGDTTMTYETR